MDGDEEIFRRNEEEFFRQNAEKLRQLQAEHERIQKAMDDVNAKLDRLIEDGYRNILDDLGGTTKRKRNWLSRLVFWKKRY